MTIKLYKQLKDRDIVEKKLTEEISFTGYTRDEIDVESPVILIESTSDLTAYNYVYIEEFSRYYFIEKHRIIRNNLWEFTLQEDYLYTWKDTMYSWTVQLERAEGLYNTYFNDNRMQQVAGNNITTWKFTDPDTGNNTGFSDDEHFYILTAGGD